MAGERGVRGRAFRHGADLPAGCGGFQSLCLSEGGIPLDVKHRLISPAQGPCLDPVMWVGGWGWVGIRLESSHHLPCPHQVLWAVKSMIHPLIASRIFYDSLGTSAPLTGWIQILEKYSGTEARRDLGVGGGVVPGKFISCFTI